MAIYRPACPEDESYLASMARLSEGGYPPLASRILANRGIADTQSAEAFLHPDIGRLGDPYRIPDMDRAVARIRRALSERESITIYGDYDVDGVTASVLVYRVLKDMGARVRIYVPDRHSEGYGLHADAIRTIAASGVTLIITVDCGIHAIPEALVAIECGVDLLITDHHECGEELPEAVAVVNPKRMPEGPERMIAGVGVAAKLIQALCGMDALERYMDLVGLGTIADIVPLLEENRIYAHAGLKAMNESPCPGLAALIRTAGLSGKAISAGNVAFALAPRLNAAGRMELASDAVNLLLAEDVEQAAPLAESLDRQNSERQAVLQEIVSAACEGIGTQVDLSRERILTLWGEDWHKGVIGIAASRLTEMYHRPVIMLSVAGETATASARSIAGFDLYQALLTGEDLYDRFGGHPMAAGFTMAAANIAELKDRLRVYADRHLDPALLIPAYAYDATLVAPQIPDAEMDCIGRMEPFGLSNPAPVFYIAGGSPMAIRTMGAEDQHLRMQVGLGRGRIEAVAFRQGSMRDDLLISSPFSMVGALETAEWMGSANTQFIVRHMKRTMILDDFTRRWTHRRLHDAFFRDILYNDAVPPPVEGALPVPEEACAGPMGGLFVGFTVSGTERWHVYLRDSGLVGQVLWGLGGSPPNAVPGQSVLVTGPEESRVPLEGIGHIWLLEAERPIWSRWLPQSWRDRARVWRSDEILRASLARETVLTRDHLAAVYKYLRGKLSGRWAGYDRLLDAVRPAPGGQDVNALQLLLSLDVLAELALIERTESKQGVSVRVVPEPVPRKLDESPLYRAIHTWLRIEEEGPWT